MRLAPADLRTKLPAPSKIFPLSIKNLKIGGIREKKFLISGLTVRRKYYFK
jgi:hypothetical protein